MQKIFHNILLPVCLNRVTDTVVEHVVELANRMECNLHILYIDTCSNFTERISRLLWKKQKEPAKKLKLLVLQYRFANLMHPGYFMTVRHFAGKMQEEIIDYSLSHSIDLVCLWNQPSGFFTRRINASMLASATQCAVLHGRPQTGMWNADNIILPIGANLPLAGMRAAISLAEQQGSVIHLLAIEKPGMSKSMVNLKKVYQLLKENTTLQLVCHTMNGIDYGRLALEYARSVGGGLVVSAEEPGSESGFSQWFLARSMGHKQEIPVMIV